MLNINKPEKTASRNVLGWSHKKEQKSRELPKVNPETIHYHQKSIEFLSEIDTPNLKFKDE